MKYGAMLAALLVSAGLAVPAHADPRPWGKNERYHPSERGHGHRGREVHKHHPHKSGASDKYRRDRMAYERERREYQRFQRERERAAAARARNDWHRWSQYDHYRPDPRYGRYYADYYYRDANSYQPRFLNRNDRIYRGNDGRYYCRRPDGTTGLIIGALGGGVLGNILAPGDSQTIATLIGGGLGAVLGREIERNNVKCR